MTNSLGVRLSKNLQAIGAYSSVYLQGRLISLDVFRGIAIAVMIIGANRPGEAYPALLHADWNGWTFVDLFFPFFLFIMGVAIPYSIGSKLNRGESKRRLLSKVVRRSIILFALGLFVNGFPYFDLPTIRIMGVLQRIALCYFFSSLIFLTFRARKQIYLTVLLPIAYWALLVLVPVPGYGPGVLSKEGNLVAYLDNLFLSGHLYELRWDPEGLLSTVPAVATTMLGVLAGEVLRSDRSSLGKAVNLFFFGNLCVVIGSVWDLWFPINKNLWTSSYVAFTGGMALVILAACYCLVDIKKYTVWTKPFIILGMNAIVVYMLSEIANLALIYASVPLADGTSISLRTFIYENYFAPWAGSLNGSLLYVLACLMLWLGVMAVLYRRGIFIRI